MHGVSGEATALVGTGFDGYLAVPLGVSGQLPRTRRTIQASTASGEVLNVPVYVGPVELLDQPRPIQAAIIVLGDEFLLGIESLDHFRVTFDHGRRVIVEP